MATSKQQQNRKKFTKEYKVKEIQKSLTKKARLKKGYLKALKEEGYNVPERKPVTKTNGGYRNKNEQERSKNFEERIQIKKQRKQLQREQAEEGRKREEQRLKDAKKKLEVREKRKSNLTKKTRSGQPLMAPKIEDLLSKIKDDDTYTR